MIAPTIPSTCTNNIFKPGGMYSEQYSAAPSGSGPKQRGKKSMMVSLMTILSMRQWGLTYAKQRRFNHQNGGDTCRNL